MKRMLAALVLLAVPVPAAGLEMDRLRMLTAEEHQPWRAVGRVNVATFDERGMCTGTLIGETLVITAAHCVISDRTGQPQAPGNVHFVAGWRRGTQVGHSVAQSITVHPGYRGDGRTDLASIGTDIALIRLKTPIPAARAPHFRIGPAPGPKVPLTLISYRRDRAHALTRQEGCRILGARGPVLALGCDVTFGASGSPIFAEIDGERRLIAVISAMSRKDGKAIAWAVRIDAAIAPVLAALD